MFEKGLKEIAPLTHIFGQATERLPNTTCFALEGVEADMALIRFDMAGVSVSSGSACSSGKVAPSHVLAALGASEALARSAIRVSLGWASTEDDVRQALTVWREIVNSESQPERALAV